jgi:hypothetical protein
MIKHIISTITRSIILIFIPYFGSRKILKQYWDKIRPVAQRNALNKRAVLDDPLIIDWNGKAVLNVGTRVRLSKSILQ